MGPRLSVVDYDAWENGYMPPSEHVLIDHLSRGAAKVVMSSTGSKHGYWLVTMNGKLPPRKHRLLLWEMLEVLAEDDGEHLHPLAAEHSVQSAPKEPTP